MSKRNLSTAEKAVIAVAGVLIGVSVLIVAAMILMNVSLLKDQSGRGNVTVADDIKTPTTIKEKVVNFLIVGVADDPSERDSTSLTDTIMVASIDVEKNSISVLQIPRDSYVGNETPTGKINAIYKQDPDDWDYAGLEGLMQMVHEMFQINIDHYVTMQMDGFEKMVNQLGGVTMDVPVDMELNGTYVSAGEQTLNGEQAIAVVRTRNVYLNADLGRLDTQKVFISALADKCLSMGVSQMTQLIPTLFRYVSTDLTVNEALDYYSLAGTLDLKNVAIMTVPGVADYVDGQSVYSIYPNRSAQLMNAYFRPYSSPITEDDLQIHEAVSEPPISEEEKQQVAYLSDLKDGKPSDAGTYEASSGDSGSGYSGGYSSSSDNYTGGYEDGGDDYTGGYEGGGDDYTGGYEGGGDDYTGGYEDGGDDYTDGYEDGDDDYTGGYFE